MSKQQTAVEWLMQNIEKTLPNFIEAWRVEYEQAKQMEKEQIISAHKEGNKYNGWALRHEHEKYYNETYK